MKKFYRWAIILAAVAFFLTALTLYLNRVVFPSLIKKIAIEQAQNFLKRKVEINSIGFNWVKGFVVDKIKVYQDMASPDVFVQAEKISLGIIYIPGLKKHKLTIPFINIYNPSAHLVRTDATTWNFSDLISGTNKDTKPSPVDIALGAVNIIDGKIKVDDISRPVAWSEYFDNINFKVSLSYKGITFDLAANIPQKKGLLNTTGTFMPLTGHVHADIRLKNIDTSSYLSLIKIDGLKLTSGVVDHMDLNIDYHKEKTTIKGDALINTIDVAFQDKSLTGNCQLRDFEVTSTNGPLRAQGQLYLSKAHIAFGDVLAQGDMHADIHELTLDKGTLIFNSSLKADHLQMALSDDRRIQGDFTLENIKARQSKDGLQVVGTVVAQNFIFQQPQQSLKATTLTLKPLTLQMADENNISIQGDASAEGLLADNYNDQHAADSLTAQDITLNITNKKDWGLTGKVTVNDFIVNLGEAVRATGSIKADQMMVKLVDGQLDLHTQSTISDGKIILDKQKTLTANPQLTLTLHVPMAKPLEAMYEGSLTVDDASLEGFPYSPIKNIGLDVDFKTDEASINALTVNVLDTDLRASGVVKNFKSPILNFNAEANDLDLSKLRNVIPDLLNQNGLNVDGHASVKIKFEGLASDWLSGKILAVASLKNANVSSSKFNQTVNGISGIVEATPNSLKWRDFIATYLGKQYTLTGQMNDFKNPKINTSLDGDDVQLKADIAKDNDLVTINTLTGKYLNMAFGVKGTTTFPSDGKPLLDVTGNVSLRIEDALNFLPEEQKKILEGLKPTGMVTVNADLKGVLQDWKNWTMNATVESPLVSLMGYTLNDLHLAVVQSDQKIKNMTLDGLLYDGKVHAVSSIDLTNSTMPFELALNIDRVDLHQLKMDTPLKEEELNGKLYLTAVADGYVPNIKNFHAKGSFAIREGFLTEFAIFKGLLSALNEALRLGQVMITDVESNFTVDHQKISTDSLRLKSPTIVLQGDGWVDFDQNCDFLLSVDLSSGIVPPIAEDVLSTLQIHIFDKISKPTIKHKISVPQVINSILKSILN